MSRVTGDRAREMLAASGSMTLPPLHDCVETLVWLYGHEPEDGLHVVEIRGDDADVVSECPFCGRAG